MPLAARIILAIFAALFAAMMFVSAPESGGTFHYVFAGFCLSIAIASLAQKRVAQFFGSIIALGVLAASAGYLFHEVFNGKQYWGAMSEPSLFNAIAFCIVFGGPAYLYLKEARFGFGAPVDPAAQEER